MAILGVTKGAVVFKGEVHSQTAFKVPTGSTLPATAIVGDIFIKTGTSAGLYVATALNTWTQSVNGEGLDLSYANDTLTIGAAGSPTDDQTIQATPSTSGDQATISVVGAVGTDGNGGTAAVRGGDGSAGGGSAVMTGGDGTAGDTNGGDIVLSPGAGHGTGTSGSVLAYRKFTCDGPVQGNGFKSSDGTAGLSTSITVAEVTTITVKNGLITAVS